jgi:hypothetical protein
MKDRIQRVGADSLRSSLEKVILTASFLAVLYSPAWSFKTNPTHPAAGTLTAGQQVVQVFSANGYTWVYLCYLPFAYDNQPTKQWPMIIYQACQGALSDGAFNNVYSGNCSGMSGLLQTPQNYHVFSDSFVIVTPWIGSEFSPEYKGNDSLFQQYYPPFVSHLAGTVRIDTMRINVMGFCEGANIAMKMVSIFPKLPASLSIWGLWLDPANPNDPDTTKFGLLKNIPMNFTHGAQDFGNAWQNAKRVVDGLTRAGNPDVHWRLDPNAPHEVWQWSSVHLNVTDTLWYPWMLAQRKLTQPLMKLSDSVISVSYDIGAQKAVKTATITVKNTAALFPYSGTVTVSKKSSWLTVTVDASHPDSQVITNSIDPASFQNADTKYYDTVTVHAAGAKVVDQTFRVVVWVRPAAVLTSVSLTPASNTITNTQSIQFVAVALDQFSLPMVPQPALTWSSTGGSIDANGLFKGCIGSYTASVAVNGSPAIKNTASILVKPYDYAFSATPKVSSTQGGSYARMINDGFVAAGEWASGGEKAGAWAQLTWTTAVTLDSVALWDRVNTADQATAGTLTFSDGSASVAVGTLPNNGATPWTATFSPRTVTWVKFTADAASATTQNVGLLEFEVFNTKGCPPATGIGRVFAQPAYGETILSTYRSGNRLYLDAKAKGKFILTASDCLGRMVMLKKGSGIERIDMTQKLTMPGVYLIKIQNDNKVQVLRLMKTL